MTNINKNLNEERTIHNRIASLYESVFNQLYLYRKSREATMFRISGLIKDNRAKILDVGCGTGEVLQGLSTLGYKHLYGVDISEEMVKIARKKSPNAKICRASAHSLPYNDSSFDAVLFVSVFHHFPEQLDALSEAKRILKKDGLLYLCEPTDDWFFSNWVDKVWYVRIALMPLTAMYLFLRFINKRKIDEIELINKAENYTEHHKHVDKKRLLAKVRKIFKVSLFDQREVITPIYTGVIFNSSWERIFGQLLISFDLVLSKMIPGMLLTIVAKK